MFIRGHALTQGLSQSEFERLETFFTPVEYPAGDRIYTEGAKSPGLLLVLEGQLTVSKKDSKQQNQTLSKLVAPTILGEIELISHDICNASVTTDTAVNAKLLPPDEFDRLLTMGDTAVVKIVRNIAKVLVKRLEKINARYVAMMDWNV